MLQVITANTILYCTKWEETVAFYKDVLKLEIGFANDWFVEFNLNRCARLSVANEQRASIKSSHGTGITIGLHVENIQNLHAYLTDAGGAPTKIKELWGSNVFYVHDPELCNSTPLRQNFCRLHTISQTVTPSSDSRQRTPQSSNNRAPYSHI